MLSSKILSSSHKVVETGNDSGVCRRKVLFIPILRVFVVNFLHNTKQKLSNQIQEEKFDLIFDENINTHVNTVKSKNKRLKLQRVLKNSCTGKLAEAQQGSLVLA